MNEKQKFWRDYRRKNKVSCSYTPKKRGDYVCVICTQPATKEIKGYWLCDNCLAKNDVRHLGRTLKGLEENGNEPKRI